MKALIYCPLLVFIANTSFSQKIWNDTIKAVASNSGQPVPIRKKPNVDAKEIIQCNSMDTVTLLEYTGNNYFMVLYKEKVGYLRTFFLSGDSAAVAISNQINFETGNTQRLTYSPRSADGKTVKKSSTPSRSQSYLPSRTIHTGPRGGKYYINKNGKKTYVKQ